jgi:hypothetical protein
MVSGLAKRKRPLAAEAWQQPQNEPDWGLSREREHPHDMSLAEAAERERAWQEIMEWLELERVEARQLAWKLLRGRRAETDFTTLEEVLRICWERRRQEQAMARLEAAAKVGDRCAFLEALKEVEQWDWSPEDFARAVRLALEASTHLAARRISEEGVRRYPDNLELQKYAQALSPPKLISNDLPPDSGIAADQEWLEAHRGEYRGKWVAVRGGNLLGAADSLEGLIAQVGNTEGALLTTGY